MRWAKPLAPARSTAARVTLKVTPWTAAAASTFVHGAISVVGLGGSSSSIFDQMNSKSRFDSRPARIPMTIPNGL